MQQQTYTLFSTMVPKTMVRNLLDPANKLPVINGINGGRASFMYMDKAR